MDMPSIYYRKWLSVMPRRQQTADGRPPKRAATANQPTEQKRPKANEKRPEPIRREVSAHRSSSKKKRGIIVVDGSNIAYTEKTSDGRPKVSNIIAVRHALERLGYAPIIIVDASLKYQVDDAKQLGALLDAQAVREAPAGTDADYFVLATAKNLDCPIISNDEYREYRSRFVKVMAKRVPLMVIRGQVELYQDRLG